MINPDYAYKWLKLKSCHSEQQILHFVQNDSLVSFFGRFTCRRIYFLVSLMFLNKAQAWAPHAW